TPAVLNAANEVAVHAFLEGRIRFTRIDTLVQRAMEEHSSQPLESIDQVLEIDRTTREIVDRWIS
ncbi:MAG: 1-deoxy-D-xylulose-5-phosphate reductoisomerase, partial [Planctomycetota bacterium]